MELRYVFPCFAQSFFIAKIVKLNFTVIALMENQIAFCDSDTLNSNSDHVNLSSGIFLVGEMSKLYGCWVGLPGFLIKIQGKGEQSKNDVGNKAKISYPF